MGKDKILMTIGDAPVIAHTLEALQSSNCIDEIVVVTKYESMQEIAIHDGARPFVSDKLIERVVCAAKAHSAAAPAVTASDTVRILNGKGDVAQTPDREHVALVQTPQVFLAELIKAALTRTLDKGLKITDDCSAVEAMGYNVTIVAGETDNIKLTSAKDLYTAEGILAERSARK